MGNPASAPRPRRRSLKICGGVTLIILLVFVIVSVTLAFTVFKPKNPRIFARPTKLEHLDFTIFPVPDINVTLGMNVFIENPNYGGFKYTNSTACVYYHQENVADVAIDAALVPARGHLNVTASTTISGDGMLKNPYLMGDLINGCLNFTSKATLHGKVILLKIFKISGKAESTCDISVFIHSLHIVTTCKSKFKL